MTPLSTDLTSLIHYINSNILKKQSAILEFFKNNHRPNHAFLCDTIYASYALYISSISLRNQQNSRIFKLSATKGMQAVLTALMFQSENVQKFKDNQEIENCLKTVFDVKTGKNPIENDENGENRPENSCPENNMLLIDDIALFVLFLCQMTTGGLEIVSTTDDIDFIQNLVYYLERAYRVADHGPHKNRNSEKPIRKTLHASTIGISKAALEAAYQCNLFGECGTQSTRLHVDPDAHNRNRMTLESMLPRQSVFEETDASLAFVVGFPCFSVENEELAGWTLERLIKTENFRKNPEFSAALSITNMLTKKENSKNGFSCLENLDFSLENFSNFNEIGPDTLRYHCFKIVNFLVKNELVTNSELDPCRRFVPRLEQNIPIPLRYNHQTVEINTVLISESSNVSNLLKSYGIKAQTLSQVAPVEIWSPKELLYAYSLLGKNSKLGFKTGRPLRPIGCLGSSKIYRIIDANYSKLVICYPLTFNNTDFYMAEDPMIVIDRIWTTLNFLARYWKEKFSPVFVILVKDSVLFAKKYVQKSSREPAVAHFLSMLSRVKQGNWQGVKTRIVTVSEHLSSMESPICLDMTTGWF